jgi:hypothetical protein
MSEPWFFISEPGKVDAAIGKIMVKANVNPTWNLCTQLPITAGWPQAMWIPKLAQRLGLNIFYSNEKDWVWQCNAT